MGAEILAAILPSVIAGGASVYGASKAAGAAEKGAETEAKAIEKGIDLEREMYRQDRKDLEPYRGLGSGAVGNLAYLSGITLPPPEAAIQASQAAAPAQMVTAAPKPPTSALPGRGDITVGRLAPWANSPKFQGAAMNQPRGLVRVRSPQGTVHLIPADQVSAAEASGGVRV